jgi:hypothetical protein
MKPLTPERIAEIEKRCNAATAGPWFHRQAGMEGHGQAYDWIADAEGVGRHSKIIVSRESVYGGTPDYSFIAHARTDIPDLVSEVKRLRAELERLSNE